MSIVDNPGTANMPIKSYNFMLRVEGIFDLPCKSVHNFSKENEFDTIQEGGVNDYVHMIRKPISKPFTFTVERYVGVDHAGYNPLQEGAELMLPLLLFVSDHHAQFGTTTRRVYIFTGCTVVSRDYGTLDAEKSGLMTESTVIAYRELVVMTFPERNPTMWKMDKNKGKKGTDPHHRSIEGGEVRPPKDKMRLWTMPGGITETQGLPPGKQITNNEDPIPLSQRSSVKNSAVVDNNSTMPEDPRIWEFPDTPEDYEGSGTRSAFTDVDSTNVTDPRLWEFGETADDYMGSGNSAYPDIDSSDAGDRAKKWEFTKGRHKDYKGKNQSAVQDTDSTMPENPRIWEIDPDNPKGSGNSAIPDNNSTKPEKPRKWEIDPKNPQGKGNSAYPDKDSTKQDKPRIWKKDPMPKGSGNSAYPDKNSSKPKNPRKWKFSGKSSAGTGQRSALKPEDARKRSD